MSRDPSKGMIVTGLSRLEDLPALPPRLSDQTTSTSADTKIKTEDTGPTHDSDDRASDSGHDDELLNRDPDSTGDRKLAQLSLADFIELMKVRDPSRAPYYDEASFVLQNHSLGCDVLAQVGAEKLASIGIKLGAAYRMMKELGG